MVKNIIELKNLSKVYDEEIVVDSINLTIKENEFLTILGPSGCGKTTTLRMIGGFVNNTSGEILFNKTNKYGVSKICFVFTFKCI